MSTSAIEIRDLSYSYQSNWSFRRRRALVPFSLEVDSGEAFGFLGHNGAGKTTTIKCILNLINPTAGTIRLFGKDFRDPSSRLAVGYIPEQPYFYDNLLVRELLELYGKLAGLHGGGLNKRISECADRVGVGDRLTARLRTLSKGLMQRVALAQALLAEPKLLILDEPFSGLDPIGRREFREIFHELSRGGTTLFISSHVLPDVEYLCNRVSIMVKGELKGVFKVRDIPRLSGGRYELVLRTDPSRVADLAARALRSEKLSEGIRLEYSNQEESEAALRTVLDRKITVESYQFLHIGLEGLFVKLVKGGV